MRLMKETIQLEKQVGAASSRAVVEGSMTLPGGLRETAHILYCGASASVERVEALQDRASVSGRVTFHTLYTQGDPEKLCVMEAASDFTHVMELPGATGQCVCHAWTQVRSVNATASGGQLSVRAEIGVEGRALAACPVEALTGVAEVDGLQVATAELAPRTTAASGTSEVMLREEFDLPASLNIRETLFATATPVVEEVTGGSGRAGVSGTVRLEVYHATGQADAPLAVTRHAIAFEGGVELAGGEGELLCAEAWLKDVAVASQESGEEGRTLRVEVVLGLEARADCVTHLTVLRDAYTTTGSELKLTGEQVAFRDGETRTHAAESGKALVMLDEKTPPVRTVMAAFASPELTGWHQAGTRLAAEGVLHVTLIALPTEGAAPLSISLDAPFRQTFAAQALPGDQLLLRVTDVDAAAITGDRVELRYVIHLDVTGVRTGEAALITDAAPEPAAPADGSIVLYFAQPGETLWDIARRFRVTVAEIRRLNPELTGEILVGQGVVVWRRCAEELYV